MAGAVAVVEGDHGVVEVEGGVVAQPGPAGGRRHPLQAPPEIVGEVADRPALERRQAGQQCRAVARQQPPQGGERRPVEGRVVPERPAAADAKPPERIGGEVGEAPEPVIRDPIDRSAIPCGIAFAMRISASLERRAGW